MTVDTLGWPDSESPPHELAGIDGALGEVLAAAWKQVMKTSDQDLARSIREVCETYCAGL